MLDLDQPYAPRIRVVVIIIMLIIMLRACDVAALLSAMATVGLTRFCMGSQKCIAKGRRSTHLSK